MGWIANHRDTKAGTVQGGRYAWAMVSRPTKLASMRLRKKTKRRMRPSPPDCSVATVATRVLWILPITPPLLLLVTMSTGFKPSCSAVIRCRLPNWALQEVWEPVGEHTPAEVDGKQFPGNRRPRFKPRTRWPCGATCADHLRCYHCRRMTISPFLQRTATRDPPDCPCRARA